MNNLKEVINGVDFEAIFSQALHNVYIKQNIYSKSEFCENFILDNLILIEHSGLYYDKVRKLNVQTLLEFEYSINNLVQIGNKLTEIINNHKNKGANNNMRARIGFRRACKELEIRFDIHFNYEYYRTKYIDFCRFLSRNEAVNKKVNLWYFDNLVNSELPNCLTERAKSSAVKSFFQWIHDDIVIQNNNQFIN